MDVDLDSEYFGSTPWNCLRPVAVRTGELSNEFALGSLPSTAGLRDIFINRSVDQAS